MQKVKVDFLFTIVLISLIGVGFSFIFSASSILGIKEYGDSKYFLNKHIINVVLGLVVCYAAAKVPYQYLRKFVPMLNIVTIGLMCLLFIPSFVVTVNGAGRWVNLLGMTFQPSELAKITIIFTLAHMIDVRKKRGLFTKFKTGILPIFAYIGFYVMLIISQKHLSATGLVLLVSLSILLIARLDKKYFITMFSAVMAVGVLGVIHEPYRLKRITGFLHPEKDPSGEGFHILQSWYAIGSGEWFGMGLGMSRQKFSWLPENHTDFIVAIIGEETGFIGILVVVALFMMLVFRGLLIALNAKDMFGMLLCSGIVILIFFQAFINMAVVSGIFPVTGMPLPFISYGGTSTIILFIGVGLIYNVASQAKITD